MLKTNQHKVDPECVQSTTFRQFMLAHQAIHKYKKNTTKMKQPRQFAQCISSLLSFKVFVSSFRVGRMQESLRLQLINCESNPQTWLSNLQPKISSFWGVWMKNNTTPWMALPPKLNVQSTRKGLKARTTNKKPGQKIRSSIAHIQKK